MKNDLRQVSVNMRSEGKLSWEINHILDMLKSSIQKINRKYQATWSVINKSISGYHLKDLIGFL